MNTQMMVLDNRRNELIARLENERAELLDAVRSMNGPVQRASQWKARMGRAKEWAPLGMALFSALALLKNRRRAARPRGFIAWAVEMWGLWRTAQSVIRTVRPLREHRRSHNDLRGHDSQIYTSAP